MITGTSTKRLVLLTAIATVLGFAGGGAAWVLIHLIQLITNVALFHEFTTKRQSLAGLHVGWSLFVAAAVGAMLISLLAKWSPVIRGHGIPEAMEAVLTKQSRIAPRTAIASRSRPPSPSAPAPPSAPKGRSS